MPVSYKVNYIKYKEIQENYRIR